MSLSIWYLNHYAAPPDAGRGERPICLARELIRGGHDVTIVHANRHHLLLREPFVEQPERMMIDGIGFRAIPTRSYRGNGVGRILNMLDYARGLDALAADVRAGLLRRPDVVIVSSPHPVHFGRAEKLARSFHAQIIFEERDLWPLSLQELAGLSTWHPIVAWIGHHVRRAYRRSDAVVTLLPDAADYLVSQGAKRSAIHYIPNGTSPARWNKLNAPLPKEHQAEFARLKAQGKFIVVYAGAHGKPNALEQLFALGEVARQPLPYHFVLIGDGDAKPALVRDATRCGASWISFLPPIPKSAIPAALDAADAGFMALRDSPLFVYGVSPNKLFDYFMAALPVLFAVRSGNQPVDEAGAGLSVAPYDARRLDEAIRKLIALPTLERAAMGLRGQNYVVERHSWDVLGRRYLDLCESLRAPSWQAAA